MSLFPSLVAVCALLLLCARALEKPGGSRVPRSNGLMSFMCRPEFERLSDLI